MSKSNDEIAAQMRADAKTAEANWICPLDKQRCNHECYSFSPAVIHETKQYTPQNATFGGVGTNPISMQRPTNTGEWVINGPWCTNYSITGERP